MITLDLISLTPEELFELWYHCDLTTTQLQDTVQWSHWIENKGCRLGALIELNTTQTRKETA